MVGTLQTTRRILYFHRQTELSVDDGCILWGRRVVNPFAGLERLLDELHTRHPGICRMKSLARSYVWWPDLDTAKVKSCTSCQLSQRSPPQAPLHPWE